MFAVSLPCVLLANKADMVHLRQVTTEEGHFLMNQFRIIILICSWRQIQTHWKGSRLI